MGKGAGVALILASLALLVFSWWQNLQIIHDSEFEAVNLAKRGLSRSATWKSIVDHTESIVNIAKGRRRDSTVDYLDGISIRSNSEFGMDATDNDIDRDGTEDGEDWRPLRVINTESFSARNKTVSSLGGLSFAGTFSDDEDDGHALSYDVKTEL